MNCPRCGDALRDRPVPVTLLCGCGTCGGIWLGREASRILAASFPQSTVLAAGLSTAVIPDKDLAASAGPCPECNGVMMRRRFTTTAPGVRALTRLDRAAPGELSVELDVCDAHGTFFDRGELSQVTRSLEASGALETGASDGTAATTSPPSAAGTLRALWEQLTRLDGPEPETAS